MARANSEGGGMPFSELAKSELRIHGYVWNDAGVTPVHRLRNGKYLRRYKRGWTQNGASYDRVCETREEAEAARRTSLVASWRKP